MMVSRITYPKKRKMPTLTMFFGIIIRMQSERWKTP